MERKTEHFFDGDTLNISKVISEFSQHPDQMDKILNFVVEKVIRKTEFRVKKEHLKEKYEHKMQKLYAEYMKDEEE